MIAVIAKLNVAAGKEAEFETAMLNLAGQVRENESGNQLYTLCKDDDGNYVVLELYETAEDLAAHGQTEHFKASGASFKGRPRNSPSSRQANIARRIVSRRCLRSSPMPLAPRGAPWRASGRERSWLPFGPAT